MHPSQGPPSNHRGRRSYADLANPSSFSMEGGRGVNPDRRSRPSEGSPPWNARNHPPSHSGNMMNHPPPPQPHMNRMPNQGLMAERRPQVMPPRGGGGRGGDFRSLGGGRGMPQPPPPSNWGESTGPPRGERGGGPSSIPMMRNAPMPSATVAAVKRSRDAGSVSSEGEILSDSELTPPPPVHQQPPQQQQQRFPPPHVDLSLPPSRGGAPAMRSVMQSHASNHGVNSNSYASLSGEGPPPRRNSDLAPPPSDRAHWNNPPPTRGGGPPRPPPTADRLGEPTRREDSAGFRRAAPSAGNHYGPSPMDMGRREPMVDHPPAPISHLLPPHRPLSLPIASATTTPGPGRSFADMVSGPPDVLPPSSSYAALDAPRSAVPAPEIRRTEPQRHVPPERQWPERMDEDPRGGGTMPRAPERWNDRAMPREEEMHFSDARRGDAGRGGMPPGGRGDPGRGGGMPSGGRGEMGRGGGMPPGGRGEMGRGGGMPPGGRGEMGRGGMPLGGRGEMSHSGMPPGGRGEMSRGGIPSGGRGEMGHSGMPLGGRGDPGRGGMPPGERGEMGRGGMPLGGRGEMGHSGMPLGGRGEMGHSGMPPGGRGGRGGGTRGGRGKSGGREGGGGRGSRRGRPTAAADSTYRSSMVPPMRPFGTSVEEFRVGRDDGSSMPREPLPTAHSMAKSVGEKAPFSPVPLQEESHAQDHVMTDAETPSSTTAAVVETPESTHVVGSAIKPDDSTVAIMVETPPRPVSPPPPPAAEPSALVLATIRWADLEAQMDYEYAKFCRLAEQQERLRAEYQCLEGLAVGIPSFQADYDAHVAATTTTLIGPDATSG